MDNTNITDTQGDTDYNSIVESSNIISELKENNQYVYTEIEESFLEPVKIGCMTIDEFKLNPIFLEPFQHWNIADSAYNAMINSQRMYTKIKFEEDKHIRSDSVVKTSGLSKKILNLDYFSEDNLNIFQDVAPSIQSDFSEPLQPGTCVELYGYFTSDVTGIHHFSIPVCDTYQIWIDDDSAIVHYNKYNADANSKNGFMESNRKYASIMIEKNQYYPIRIHLGNQSTAVISGPLLRVTLSNDQLVTANSDFQYFNVLSENGSQYNKKPFYFSLVKLHSSDSNSPKFLSYFFRSNDENYNKIKNLKTNFPLIYKRVEVPTTITYTSGIYNKQAEQGSAINVENPVGSKMDIIESKWGYPKTQTETVRIDPKFIDYDPSTEAKFLNDVINENSKNNCSQINYSDYLKYKDGKLTKKYNSQKSISGPGFYLKKYVGKTIADVRRDESTLAPTEHSTTNISSTANQLETSTKTTNERVETYVFEADLSPSWHWGLFQVYLRVVGRAEIYINGGSSPVITAATNQDAAPVLGDLAGFCKKFKMYYQTENYRYGIQILLRDRYKRGRWRWGGWVNLSQMTPSHNVTVNISNDCKYSIKAKDPVPKKEVFNYQTNDILPSSIDTKNSLSQKIDQNLLELDGDYSNYNNLLDERVQGASSDKSMNMNYKFSQTFDTNGETSIKNKNIHIDLSGDLVIGYDYNGTTNSYPVSFLPKNQQCDGKSLCEYTLVLEDNCSISIYNNQNEKIWNKKLLDDSVNTGIIAQNPIWLKNPERRNLLNVGEKLSPSDISEIISDNGKFKLTFLEGRLSIVYGTLAYNRIYNENREIYFTSDKHKVDGHQIYFLYKANANGLMGKRFLENVNTTDNIKNIQILPQNYGNVLKLNNFKSTSDAYPLFSQNSYTNLLHSDEVKSKYSVSNLDEKTCNEQCKNSNSCEHFFFLNTSSGDTCLQDITSNTIPLYTMQNPHNNISSSSMYNKSYTIESNCLDNGAQPIDKRNFNDYSDFELIYHSELENDPNKTFLCSNDTYIMNKMRINQIYGNENTDSSIEGFNDIYHGGVDNITDKKIQPLLDLSKESDDNEVKYSKVNDDMKVLYNNYLDAKDRKDEKKEINVIPDKFKKIVDPKISATKEDAIIKDANMLKMYENTIYTIGTICAASLVITAIVISRD